MKKEKADGKKKGGKGGKDVNEEDEGVFGLFGSSKVIFRFRLLSQQSIDQQSIGQQPIDQQSIVCSGSFR